MRKTKAKATPKRFAPSSDTSGRAGGARAGGSPTSHSRGMAARAANAVQAEAALLVGRTCNAKGEKVPLTNKPVVPGSDPMIKPAPQMTRECLAAQERAKQMAVDAQATTRAQELELKQRINEMLAVPCATK